MADTLATILRDMRSGVEAAVASAEARLAALLTPTPPPPPDPPPRPEWPARANRTGQITLANGATLRDARVTAPAATLKQHAVYAPVPLVTLINVALVCGVGRGGGIFASQRVNARHCEVEGGGNVTTDDWNSHLWYVRGGEWIDLWLKALAVKGNGTYGIHAYGNNVTGGINVAGEDIVAEHGATDLFGGTANLPITRLELERYTNAKAKGTLRIGWMPRTHPAAVAVTASEFHDVQVIGDYPNGVVLEGRIYGDLDLSAADPDQIDTRGLVRA